MTRAFIVNVKLDPSIDEESVRAEIEAVLTDIFNPDEFTVTLWSSPGESTTSPTTPPSNFPAL